MRRRIFPHGQRGAALAETVVVMPVLLVLVLGAVQWALIYEAKSTLNYAAFMAARAGAADHATPNSMRLALAKGLLPLYAPESSLTSLPGRMIEVGKDVALFSRIRILNPTREAFEDFGIEPGREEIPSDHLYLADTSPGARSGVSIQDANLLKIEVIYGYELKVPFVNRVIVAAFSWLTTDPLTRFYLQAGRLPILATVTVRMQTPARNNGWVLSRAEVEGRFREALGTD
ncbi:MAG TPA: pilus assembly protein [Thiotrichales bacterium]|nr:pilus assembly protein [Thiotrichales bacterium]